MIINVQLKNAEGRLLNREPILFVEDEQVKIIFESDYVLKDTVVNYRNTSCGVKGQTRVINNEFDVPSDVLREGTLQLEVLINSYGKVVKRFVVEPIIFYSADTTFIGYSAVTVLQNQVATLEEKVKVLESDYAQMHKTIGELYDIIEQ